MSRFQFITIARNRSIASAVMVIGVQRVLQIVATFIAIPLILHALGAGGFGIWGAATSLAWVGGMLDIGMGAALITLIVQGMATQNFGQARDHITVALLGTAMMMILVLIGGGTFICFTTTGTEHIAFLIALVGLAVNIPLSLSNNIWMGLQKSHIAAGWDMTQTILNLAGVLLAIYLHAGILPLLGVFYGSIVLANTLSTLHLLCTHALLRPQRLKISPQGWKQVLTSSSLLMGISIVVCLSYALDNVITLALLGSIASAQMAIAMRIGVNTIGILNALTQPLWAAFADADSKGEHVWSNKILFRGMVAMIVTCLLGGGVLVLFGEAFLHWWLKDDLGISTGLLWTIALWIFAMSMIRIPALLLNSIGVLEFQLKLFAFGLVVAIFLKFFLAVRLGITGIMLATAISWLCVVFPILLWRVNGWWREKTKK